MMLAKNSNRLKIVLFVFYKSCVFFYIKLIFFILDPFCNLPVFFQTVLAKQNLKVSSLKEIN